MKKSSSMDSEFTQECNTDWLCWLGMPLEYDGYVIRDIPTHEEYVRLYKVLLKIGGTNRLDMHV